MMLVDSAEGNFVQSLFSEFKSILLFTFIILFQFHANIQASTATSITLYPGACSSITHICSHVNCSKFFFSISVSMIRCT